MLSEKTTFWARRAGWALLGLLALWALLWAALPPLLKWQLQKQGSAVLGRTVTVERVEFQPWSLKLTVHGLQVASAADAADAAPQFSLRRLHLDAELQSLFRLAPVLDAVELDAPELRLTHHGEGRYDIDDIVATLKARSAAQPEPQEAESPTRFALFNLALREGSVHFTDTPRNAVHQLKSLELGVPFLSNLDSRRDVLTEPRLAFELNGSRFDSTAESTPFAQTRATRATLAIPALDVAPYLPYWPAAWPVRLQSGVLGIALSLDFEQTDAPQVRLSGQLQVSQLQLDELVPGQAGAGPDAAALPLFALQRLNVEVTNAQPLAQSVALSQVEVVEPTLHVRRNAAGELNLARMAQGFGNQAAPAAEASTPPAPWQLTLERLALTGGQVLWEDAAALLATGAPATLPLQNLQLQASNVQWPPEPGFDFMGSATLADAALSLDGRLQGSALSLKTALADFPLAVLRPYAALALQPALAQRLQGRVSAQARVAWSLDSAGPGEAGQDGAAVGGERQVLLDRLDLQDFGLGPEASWQSLQVADTTLDLNAASVRVGQITLERPSLRVTRNADGRFVFEDWLRQAPAPAPPPDTSTGQAAPAAPWQVTIASYLLNAGQLRWTDQMPAANGTPVDLLVSGLRVQGSGLQPLAARQNAMPLQLEARVANLGRAGASAGTPGRLSYQGTLRLPTSSAGLQTAGALVLERLPLHGLEPYFGQRLNLELLRADASLRGQLEVALPAEGLQVALRADMALEDLRSTTRAPVEDLLDWQSLNLRGVEVDVAQGALVRLKVAETVLSDFFARVIIDSEGRINLQNLVRAEGGSEGGSEGGAEGGAQQAAASVPPAPAPAPAQIEFGPMALVNGRVFFSDRFIQPNYSANITALTGNLTAFSSASLAQAASMSLTGRVEGSGTLELTGQLNPLTVPLALDVRAAVRELELPPLTPYSVKYAGYGIERGKLSVNVSYRIDAQGQLQASNQIILNQLRFGDRVPDSTAPNLPIKLAVALLADRQGVIDINLPVSGSLNDPEFRLGPIIVRLVVNLIGRAITAPFALIANALGGGGNDLQQVEFAAGTASLDAAAKERLNTVAKALLDRPALRLTVLGEANLEAERMAYRRAQLDAQVLAEKRRQAARNGATPQEVNAINAVGADEYPALLEEVYRRADITKPRNLVGLAKDLPQDEMEALLLAAIPATDDLMRALAVQRGVAVKDYLASQQVPEARLFLGTAAPVSAAPASATAPTAAPASNATTSWQPRAELRLEAN